VHPTNQEEAVMPRTRTDDAPTPVVDEPQNASPSAGPGDGTVAVGTSPADVPARAAEFIAYLETGEAAPALFAPDVFVDFTLPRWRLQAAGRDDALALRRAGHPAPGRVPRSRLDPTPTGFVLEVEETWDDGGEHWYCRELFRADVGPEGITELAVYCTGDWDRARVAEHAAAVRLIRP
jgi:hypothetical protein